MAYKSRKRSSTRSSYSRRSSRSASKSRKSVRRSPQTVKIVIEHVGASPVSRPELQGLVEKPKGKAKF